jgi:hypothetical protein
MPVDTFTQLTEYFRLIDEFNAISSANKEYNHDDPNDLDIPELKELARRINEKKKEIRLKL